MITIPLGNDVRAEVIDSVLGQLSDGIWENSNGMNKYWSYADVNKNNELQVDDTSWRSGFNGKSEEWVRNWFADKAKQVVKIWAEDWGKGKDVWKRDNQDEVDYMGGHIVRDITVSDVYECYDYLKRRKGTYNYGKTEPAEVAPEVPAEVSPVTPKTSGGMNPSQQDLEDFFLDASTKTKGRKIAASSDIESIKDEVRKKLTEEIREVLWDYEDALGIKVSSEIPEYRLDWCLESFGPEEERKFDKLLDAIVSYEIDGLFYYADEE